MNIFISDRTISERTLNLKKPFGQTILIALFILGLALGLCEFIVRQPQVQAYLDAPSLNSRHRNLEKQWYRLETLSASGVPINCLALGNSMILSGFDPKIFAQKYNAISGEELVCFNFGVDALTPVSASILAEILIDTYHPKYLIFGTDARDLSIPPGSEETAVITEMAWIQYRLGRFNPEGWLVDHSYLYRYRRNPLYIFHNAIGKQDISDAQKYGFEPLEGVTDVIILPDPSDDAYHIQYYFKLLSNYTIWPENLAALTNIIELRSTGTEIVVVTMPVPETYLSFFDHPTDYQSFIDVLQDITSQQNVLLLISKNLSTIPDDGWRDYSHLNRKGASAFSEWLGNECGNAVINSHIDK